MYVVKRDEKPIAGPFEDESAAFGWLLRHQSQSTDWAIKYEGYAIEEIQPWNAEEAKQISGTARRVFADHGHPGYWDELTRDSCGACALGGWKELETEQGDPAPNYAGWGRMYVEAQRWIPERWRAAFYADELHGDNVPYAVALARSIATFGVRFGA